MATSKKIQSIEPNIADIANSWLKSYKLDYKLEQESLNAEIDRALMTTIQKSVALVETDQMQSFC